MFYGRLSFLILFIPIAIGVNENVSKPETTHNTTSSAPKNLLQKEDNSTRKGITLPVEGGGDIIVAQLNTSIIKENDGILLSKMPSEEFGGTSTKTKGHVVGRTGAPVMPDLNQISTKSPVDTQKSIILAKLNKTKTVPPQTKTVSPQTKTVPPQTKTVPPQTKTVPHKPQVLTYKEEGGSIIVEKMSHPGIGDGSFKTQANKAGSHPGMIMPIVITILVVPLFAVLGYMALKRGQEAWKNRHYKRMDFLLDGMYND